MSAHLGWSSDLTARFRQEEDWRTADAHTHTDLLSSDCARTHKHKDRPGNPLAALHTSRSGIVASVATRIHLWS